METVKKRGRGRPAGSKNKPKNVPATVKPEVDKECCGGTNGNCCHTEKTEGKTE